MLFNSYIFLFLFLPVAIIGFALAGRIGRTAQIIWLGFASLVFYAWWSFAFTGLLLASLLFNFAMGRLIQRPKRSGFWVLCFAVVSNIALLGYFKYWDFFANNLVTSSTHAMDSAIPLGLSFYTFTQIAYLVDCYRRQVKPTHLANHLLFVSYFPHLIAGPLFHNRQMMPQFENRQLMRLNAENMSIGITLFTIGLFKKVVIADGIAPMADRTFNAQHLTLLDSWVGVIAYALQIYFDFSGYSDMAIGLSKIFNIDLPVNFNSPYKATSIIDFWRRWHITLSQFLRDYLYIPLGGNRRGSARRYINLLLTMLLGGLWHGANWTFIVWGGLHGLFLVINSAWQAFSPIRLRPVIGLCLTMTCVMVAWVFFRADSVHAAANILRAMAGLNGIELPSYWFSANGSIWSLLTKMHMIPANMSATFGGFRDILKVAALIAVVWLAPNSQQIVRLAGVGFVKRTWQPTLFWALIIGGLAYACVVRLGEPSRFLYYQF